MKKILLVAALSVSFASAKTHAEDADKGEAKPVPEAFSTVTQHQGTFAGKRLRYQAKIHNIILKRQDGSPYAEAVLTSYTANGDNKARPVTFVFNGGPGSASTWLHMGVFGPKRVVVPSDAADAGLPPYPIEDNSLSILDITDLVFIDPIGTGYSRLVGDGSADDVWGMDEDARSVSEMVREWVRQEKRWNSPKYIAGESFGTTRAAAMMPFLQEGPEAIRMNGLILISQALDYTGSTPTPDNLIAYVTYLPSLAATAWYHRQIEKTAQSLEAFLQEVRAFTTNEYLPALFMGSSLDENRFNAVAQKLAAYTGIDLEYIKKANLRIMTGRFAKELLRDGSEIVGRLDARYRARDLDTTGANARFDASTSAIGAAYVAGLRDHLYGALGVTLERPYLGSGPEVGNGWVYYRPNGYWEPEYVNTAPDLADAMVKNPSMRVMVASGYYDLITPFFDAEYTFARHGIDQTRVTMTYYEAGHAMYFYEPALEKLVQDVRAFIAGN